MIDRSLPLHARFDDRQVAGYSGDTLASALLANGTRLVARSFKYHRPRGILTSGSEEPNALVELRVGARREPNTRATTTELYEGLESSSQNRWPSVGSDRSRSIPVGPISPASTTRPHVAASGAALRAADPRGRRSGRAGDPGPLRAKAYAFCDARDRRRPGGFAAARAAARTGARVTVLRRGLPSRGALRSSARSMDARSGMGGRYHR